MKKLICLLLSLVLLVSLAACGQKPADTTPDTSNNTENLTEKDEANAPDNKTDEAFSFTLADVALIPGAGFVAGDLPAATSTFEVPSCALEGMDTVYSYDSVEVTVYDDGVNPIIYSIYLVDPNTATDEGLYLGDDRTQVETLYGTDYEEEGTELVYTKGSTQLRIILEDDLVVSVELRLITM